MPGVTSAQGRVDGNGLSFASGVTMQRVAAEASEGGFHLTNEGWFSREVRGAVASACWDIPATEGCALTAVEFYHPGSINPGHVHTCVHCPA